MISVTVKAGESQRKLNRLAAKITDRRGVNANLATKLTAMVLRNFESESHDGNPWASLAPSTLRGRERRQGKKLSKAMILQDTGFMKQSFQPFSDNTLAGVGALSNVQVNPETGVDHADLSEIHELGKGRVPARPMLPGKPLALQEAVKIYSWFIARAVQES